MELNFLALHGFLGAPGDWDPVIKSSPSNWKWHCPDYTNIDELCPQKNDLSQWPQSFSKWLTQQKHIPNKLIFIGYSQGARLGMHLLENHSDLFEAYFFLSGQAFFSSQNNMTQEARYLNDLKWAESFQKDSWAEVLHKWNSQPIFKHSQENVIVESPQLRKIASSCLQQWSLSKQNDLSACIEKNINKIYFIVGEHDQKYIETTKELNAKVQSKLQWSIIPQAGHRLLQDQPDSLIQAIKMKLNNTQ